jgi:hypothetical protein
MESEAKVRAWQQTRNVETLGEQLRATVSQRGSISRATANIPTTVVSFDRRILSLEPKLDLLQGRLQASMAEHGDVLKYLAMQEMEGQKQRLLTYRAQARFALASIYDRMSARNK